MNDPTRFVVETLTAAALGKKQDPSKIAVAIVVALDSLPEGAETIRDSVKVMLAALCTEAGIDPDKGGEYMAKLGYSPLPVHHRGVQKKQAEKPSGTMN